MSQINPFVGSIIQTPLAQRQQAAERATQARQKQDLARNSGLHGSDQFEHQVESAEAVAPSHDGEKREQKRNRPGDQATHEDGETDDKPHLDLTA